MPTDSPTFARFTLILAAVLWSAGSFFTRVLTAATREYAPSGYDGHFVAFREAVAQKDVAHFLVDALAGKVPKVGR